MIVRRLLAGLAAAAVALVPACSSTIGDSPTTYDGVEPTLELPGPESTGPTQGEDSSAGTDHVRVTPTAVAGTSDQAVGSVCEAFAVGYGEFSPFDFEPAADWMARWDMYASTAFIGQEQLNVVNTWSWTWQRKVKAFDVRILKPAEVTGEGARRTAVVATDRLILGMNQTGDKATTQQVTFTCDMLVRGASERAQVVNVTQTFPGPPEQ